MILEIIVLIVLIALSGFFSGAEIALFSLSNIKVRKLIRNRRRGAKTLRKLKSNPHRMLVTILIGNNIVNIGAASLATVLAIDIFGSAGVGIVMGIMTFLILIFGEIVPKSFFHQNAERMSLVVAQPVHVLGYVLYPIIVVAELVSKGILRLGGVRRKKDEITEEEIMSALSLGAEAGVIERDEEEMMQNVIGFGDSTVKGIMIPKKRMVTLRSDERLIDAMTKMLETHYSRIPVYGHGTQRIIGIVNLRNILGQIKAENFDVPLVKLVSPVLFVNENNMLDDVLERLREHAVHMAVVTNRRGQVTGVVTMEDLLEEIVGEIYDEADRKRVRVHFIDRKTAIVKGDMLVKDLQEKIGLPLKSKFPTISDLLSSRLYGKPTKGDSVELKNFTLTVMGVDKKDPSVIKRIKIVKRRGKIRK